MTPVLFVPLPSLVRTIENGAENSRTSYEHDGHDRLARTLYPSATKGAGASNPADYEELGYDAGSNVTSFRNRSGQVIAFSYDNLNRPTLKDLPGTEPDVSYGYDLLGRLKTASQSGHSLSFTYDALGRNLTQVGPHGTVSSAWDLGGRRTKLTYPDGFVADYTYLVTGEMKEIKQNNGLLGQATTLITFAYDDLGRRTSLSRVNGTSTSYGYDPVSRLSQIVQNAAGTANDLTLGFSYNPASQITSNTRSNDVYAWSGHGNGTATSPANGLNQLTDYAGATINHDAKGNMLNDPTIGYTYGYSSENLLTTASGGPWTGTLRYDPLMRLYESGVSGKSRFVYDGDTRIAEYYSSGAQTYRFVHGPGVDEPLIEYSGSGLGTRLFLHADERGSIIATSDNAGNVTSLGRYDEYGKTQTSSSRFGYTGQPYETLSELYYYRARMFNPRGPRFMQPDPIGWQAGPNGYGYVGGDPVNLVDPLGLQSKETSTEEIVVTGIRRRGGTGGGTGGGVSGVSGRGERNIKPQTRGMNPAECVLSPQCTTQEQEIVVTCDRVCQERGQAAVILAQRFGPPPSLFARPPSWWPRPPGWNNDWIFRHGETFGRGSKGDPRWIDPKGGHWRWHSPDKWHKQGHWDHNPWTRWNSPWQHIYGAPAMTPREWNDCYTQGRCV